MTWSGSPRSGRCTLDEPLARLHYPAFRVGQIGLGLAVDFLIDGLGFRSPLLFTRLLLLTFASLLSGFLLLGPFLGLGLKKFGFGLANQRQRSFAVATLGRPSPEVITETLVFFCIGGFSPAKHGLYLGQQRLLPLVEMFPGAVA